MNATAGQAEISAPSSPEREAIVLVAGDKAGRWSAWYAEAVPLAEERYAAYRREAGGEEE